MTPTATFAIKSVELPTRVKLQYVEQGDPSGIPAVWGDQDEIIPRSEQDALAAAIAGSRLLVYPGIGHGLHWEAPERFAEDLVSFTEDVAGREKGEPLDE
jgi:hypothetical protein